jgi:hypothetical protein
MAFDQPLEADRVDDLNFFSTIIRAPVVGALFWFLGGEEAKQRDEEEKTLRAQLFGNPSEELDDDSWRSASSSSRGADCPVDPCSAGFPPRRSTLKKAPPSMAESEVSTLSFASSAAGTTTKDRIEQCSESLDHMTLEEFQNATAATSLSLKRKKELSWSDESGHNLVEYIGEVRYCYHGRTRKYGDRSQLFWFVVA